MPMDILSALTERPKELDFVLPGLLAGTVGAIVSPGGSGKSTLALQLTAQIAGSPDLAGIGPIKQGSAAYLSGEDPEIILRHRLYALSRHCSQDQLQAVAQNLLIEPLDTLNIDIMQDEWIDFIKKAASGRRLLVLDTLRSIHHLDENDSGAMSRVVGRMKMIAASTGCAVVFLHHISKSSALSGQGAEQQASRGSSVLVDNVRWQGYLRAMSEHDVKVLEVDDGRQHFVEFGVSKQNYGAPYSPTWLHKTSCADAGVAGGFTLQHAILTKRKKPTKASAPAPASAAAKEAAREFAD